MVQFFRNTAGKGGRTAMQIAILLTLMQLTLALQELEVYRLIGYEENNQVFGSKVASFNLVASHFSGESIEASYLTSPFQATC